MDFWDTIAEWDFKDKLVVAKVQETTEYNYTVYLRIWDFMLQDILALQIKLASH